ncbi:MAG: 4Fe-4S dicluster domain-containing protein [Actinomycetota bacterium]
MNRIEIDFQSCDGRRKCVKACFVNVLGWDRDARRPVVSHAEDCVHCNLCELSCPPGSIEVIPDFASLDWTAF